MHDYMPSKRIYVSFDVEFGGEYCGIVQMPADIFRVNNVGEIGSESFDRYVKPHVGAI